MKKYIVTVAVLGLLSSACNSKLDVAPPNNITDEQIQEVLDQNLTTIVKPMADALPSIFWQGVPGGDFRISDLTSMHLWAMGVKSNDIVFMGNTSDAYNQYVNITEIQGESNRWNGNMWTWLYGHISSSVNSMLNLMDDVKEENLETDEERQKASYKASGLAMRAYLYLWLMQMWSDNYTEANASSVAGVPYYDTYDPYQDPRSREAASVVWSHILDDAGKAVQLFQAAGTGFTDAPNDIDLGVACMIWARAAYAAGAWDQVIEAVDLLETKYDNQFISPENYIGDRTGDPNGFPQFTAFSRVDAAINPEVIFGVEVSNVLTGSYAGSNFPGWMNCIGDDCYGGSRLGFMCIDKRLFDQIEPNDIRRQNFLEAPVHNYYFGEKSTVTDNVPAYANLKFAAKVSPDGSTSAQYKQDIVVMRYSEAVLLKAEAQARSGQDGEAQATLSKLTTARGASAVTESGAALLSRIQLETRIEMWGEQGIEWLRNKRWGIGVDRQSGETNHTSAGVVPAGNAFTWQIPLCETLYNHDIQQNPAY